VSFLLSPSTLLSANLGSGHYDILYKANTFPTVPQQAPLQVALLDYTDEFVPMASNTNDVMTMIPGLYGSGMGEQRWSSTSYDYDTNPAPPAYAPVPTPSIAPVASSPSTMVDYVSPVRASHVSHHSPANHQSIQLEPPVTLPVTLPIHSLSQPPPTAVGQRGMPMIVERGEPFRPSRYMPGFRSCQTHSLPFQTTPFRK
jgi:ubiquitin thioesterase protein OTUB1